MEFTQNLGQPTKKRSYCSYDRFLVRGACIEARRGFCHRYCQGRDGLGAGQGLKYGGKPLFSCLFTGKGIQ